VPSLDFMQALHALAARASVPVHLDGARVFNAAIALGVDVRELAAAADSVTFCLSKGLSAPLGSILAGSAEFIGQARWMRRMVGGGLRQAGVVAAAGVVALEQMVGRLRDDHETATLLWEELRILGPELVSTAPPETNIVLVDVSAARQRRSALEWLPVLEARGVKARARDDSTIRLVTHRHVTAADVRQAARAIVDEMMVSGIEAT
jgi:threonine aldolase